MRSRKYTARDVTHCNAASGALNASSQLSLVESGENDLVLLKFFSLERKADSNNQRHCSGIVNHYSHSTSFQGLSPKTLKESLKLQVTLSPVYMFFLYLLNL